MLVENMPKNKCIFQVPLSHILSFILFVIYLLTLPRTCIVQMRNHISPFSQMFCCHENECLLSRSLERFSMLELIFSLYKY
jgi:hypothetical protein